VQVNLLLGPAGSGKTYRCLSEIREELIASPEGAPLILLAPKQATFQLERQLLEDGALQGYTRLQILSFERLAQFVFDRLQLPPAKLLSDEGRLMVLRALLARNKDRLQLFRATARLPGFAQQLSGQLRELQRHGFSPSKLAALAQRKELRPELQGKLADLALLLEAYLQWLSEHQLQDAECVLDLAAEAIGPKSKVQSPEALQIEGLWLDGFAEMTPQEMNLLAAVLPHCERATLAFCLDPRDVRDNGEESSWLSIWSVVGQTYRSCVERIRAIPGCRVETVALARNGPAVRFANNKILAHLEKHWAKPSPFEPDEHSSKSSRVEPSNLVLTCPSDTFSPIGGEGKGEGARGEEWPMPGDTNARVSSRITRHSSLSLVACANPEAEATLAAREIIRFVRAGGRYRETAIVVRHLDVYHKTLERVLKRFEIPFFVDRRESVAYHALAELTRSALRTVAFDWRHDDWFAALKTGLVSADESEVDLLENEALARGWTGSVWREPLRIEDNPELERRLEKLRQRVVVPFEALRQRLASGQFKPTGSELGAAIYELWRELKVEQQLESWAEHAATSFAFANSVHATVLEQMDGWLENVELAFSADALPLREWIPILEAGLTNLTVGVIPPALDQVLVGAIDRSRNPELRLAIVPGLNEAVFPAAPAGGTILTELDRAELDRQTSTQLGPDVWQLLSRERYYGYIAFTRPRERLVLSYAQQDEDGQTLNPSVFVSHVQKLFPELEVEKFPGLDDWQNCEHLSEIIPPLLRGEIAGAGQLETVPDVAAILGKWKECRDRPGPGELRLSRAAVHALHGSELRSSVSALEQFAACPFQFFVNYGLGADERRFFETDPRQTGTFQHEVLSAFHQQLQSESKRWRDITPQEARERIAAIGRNNAASFEKGLFGATGRSRFVANALIAQLQDFVERLVGWMNQYRFDPRAVELSFGLKEGDPPAWRLDLGGGKALLLRGKIDRVDVCVEPDGQTALAVVMDYKSSAIKLDLVLLQYGLELQLLSYLGALRRFSDTKRIFGMERLMPVGVFYVPLRARAASGFRRDVVQPPDETDNGYQHIGRFNGAALPKLDSSGASRGAQFRYSKSQNGNFIRNQSDAMSAADFNGLLDQVESFLRRHGQEIFAGNIRVEPYRKGAERACDFCVCRSVCRFDPWTDKFRVLRRKPEREEPGMVVELAQ
jgi:ATP-dependent helicase/nuclease subunit B